MDGWDLVGGREIFQFHFVSCNRLFSRAIETFTRDHYFISAQHERLGNFVWRNASARYVPRDIYRYTRILEDIILTLNEMQKNFFTLIFPHFFFYWYINWYVNWFCFILFFLFFLIKLFFFLNFTDW